jgi:hypothetical protein
MTRELYLCVDVEPDGHVRDGLPARRARAHRAQPVRQSAHYDLKSAYAALAGSAVRDAIKRRMPGALLGPRDPKTHHALDDAQGHVDLLLGLLRWHERAG